MIYRSQLTKGLLADVIIGYGIQIGFGHLNVITEHFIEAYLQIFDSGLFLLLGLDVCDVFLAVFDDPPQLVQLGRCQPSRMMPPSFNTIGRVRLPGIRR